MVTGNAAVRRKLFPLFVSVALFFGHVDCGSVRGGRGGGAAATTTKPGGVVNHGQPQQPLEDSFKNIHKMDDQECIPRLLCEMAASATKAPLSSEEASILAVFSSEKTVADKSGKSILSLYKYATDVGSSQTEENRCQKNFAKCPLKGHDLMNAFKNIIVKH